MSYDVLIVIYQRYLEGEEVKGNETENLHTMLCRSSTMTDVLQRGEEAPV